MKNWIKYLALTLLLILTMAGCQEKVSEPAETPEVTTEVSEASDAVSDQLTATALMASVNDDTIIVVDTRQSDAYNGWDLGNNGLGGHIEGSVDFSYNWLTADAAVLDQALEIKGITSDKKVILYNDITANNEAVKAYLEAKGFASVELYDLNNWVSESGSELVKYENYQLIVPAQVVKGLIDGQVQETFESADVKMVEASWGEADTSYANGHIPTAFHINTDAVEPPPAWMLADDATLEKFALDYGFQSTDTVIVSGEEQMAAYRVAVVLRYLGVHDVRVLNGGTKAWLDAGFELDTTEYLPVAVESFGADMPVNPDIIETIEELKVSLEDPKFTLVDNRTWAEHIGESTGYSYHDKAGRIPKSVYGYAGLENSYSMEYFRNPDNTMRRAEEFVALWEEQGIDLSNRLAFMCGSGWRAAEILYYADVYGVDDITLYSDGWIGWSNDPENPVETGDVQ
ncbi:MAG: thiosulfate sulfurtransferase [Clostridia bacterium]|nr:thiosulfate sulfurtransferase [Clostridia bacterium]